MKRQLIKRDKLFELLHDAKRVYISVLYRHDDFCDIQVNKSAIRELLDDLPPGTKIRARYWAQVLRIG